MDDVEGNEIGAAPDVVTGPGTGIDGDAIRRKAAVITKALLVNEPDPADGLDALAKVGGFEIGAIAGAMLTAAANSVSRSRAG